MDTDTLVNLTEKKFTVEGDRYCTLVMQMNKVEKKTGGTYRDQYYQIIMDGLVEGKNPEYDDVVIYMEPTGEETFKEALKNLNI